MCSASRWTSSRARTARASSAPHESASGPTQEAPSSTPVARVGDQLDPAPLPRRPGGGTVSAASVARSTSRDVETRCPHVDPALAGLLRGQADAEHRRVEVDRPRAPRRSPRRGRARRPRRPRSGPGSWRCACTTTARSGPRRRRARGSARRRAPRARQRASIATAPDSSTWHVQMLEAQVGAAGRPAARDQQPVGGRGPRRTARCSRRPAPAVERLDPLGRCRRPAPRHRCRAGRPRPSRRPRGPHPGSRPVGDLDQGDLRAQLREGLGQLASDRAPAEDQQPVRALVAGQRLLAGPRRDGVDALDRRRHGELPVASTTTSAATPRRSPSAPSTTHPVLAVDARLPAARARAGRRPPRRSGCAASRRRPGRRSPRRAGPRRRPSDSPERPESSSDFAGTHATYGHAPPKRVGLDRQHRAALLRRARSRRACPRSPCRAPRRRTPTVRTCRAVWPTRAPFARRGEGRPDLQRALRNAEIHSMDGPPACSCGATLAPDAAVVPALPRAPRRRDAAPASRWLRDIARSTPGPRPLPPPLPP